MARALYGPDGFFLREAPAAHFRTSVHASPLFAEAVAELLLRVDRALGSPDPLDLVDIGGGRGELVTGVLAALPESVARRVRARVVERAARPAGLDARIGWSADPPESVTGLLFANEWLDNVPVDVVVADPPGPPRLLLVDRAGREHPGPPVDGTDAAWLRRWWPLPGPGHPAGEVARGTNGEVTDGAIGCAAGDRAEPGGPRDAAWAEAVGRLRRGLAVAVDYAHTRDTRPAPGTLTGHRDGRSVPPVPDGSADLTAHVALDACAAAGVAAGAPARAAAGGPPDAAAGILLDQSTALRRLGVSGRRPPLEAAARDPAGYLRGLVRAGEAAELTDPAGLGGFGWLLHPVGITDPLAG
ncbi:SAM-dependent methyltransferase [Streptomyces sp. ST2-7A]|nr:SAM-dependent methyltransferase [Streptomyces sp. ST2-7A]MCE7083157.1 SAM-dependent methyltransferase [Streptomyces sp. ST2-7A]